MATGWIKTLSAAPLRIAISAAPNSVLLNGMIRLPSEVLPSANSTIASPAASRLASSLACSPDVRLRSRSTKIVRCSRAERAEDRPAGELRLGDEADVGEAGEDGDVGPGDMVRRKHQRALAGHFAMHGDAEAKRPGDELVPERAG